MKGNGNMIKVTIEGTAPLLMHRYFNADEPESKGRKKTGTIDWKAEGEKAAYRDEGGNLVQPAEHIESAMVKAATNFTIPGKRNKTYKDLFKAAVFVKPFMIPHEINEYEIDERRAVVQRNAVLRYRPRLDKWRLSFEIEVLDEQLDKSVVRDVLDQAGSFVGIGDYRPKFGRFKVVSWC
jgi:hypothetical protein